MSWMGDASILTIEPPNDHNSVKREGRTEIRSRGKYTRFRGSDPYQYAGIGNTRVVAQFIPVPKRNGVVPGQNQDAAVEWARERQ
jgi:hypothetical protein